MHLNRFGRRVALALAAIAVVLLAHERHHFEALQVLTVAALVAWLVFEIRHAYLQRRPS